MKVVESGGFTAAARALEMPVTTVSGQIKALEQRLGTTLLVRTTRRTSVTEIGRIYYDHCVKAVAEVAEAERALLSGRAEPEGVLRLTAAPDIGHHVLPPIVSEYLRLYPKVRVELVLTNRTVDLVSESVDLAIRPGPLKDSALMARRFRETETHLWATPEYLERRGTPTTIEHLTNHTYVGFKPFNRAAFTDGKRSLPNNLVARLDADDLECVKVFVLRGLGFGALPALICEEEQSTGRLVRVLPKWKLEWAGQTKGQLYLVYAPQRYLPLKVQAFLQFASSR